jgi:hypothetical protein
VKRDWDNTTSKSLESPHICLTSIVLRFGLHERVGSNVIENIFNSVIFTLMNAKPIMEEFSLMVFG